MIKSKTKILIIDDSTDGRRERLTSLLQCYSTNLCVTPHISIEQHEFEAIPYDLIFVHESNEQADSIMTGEWNSHDAIIVIFTGGTTKEWLPANGYYFASDEYLTCLPNLHRHLGELLKI